MFRRDARENEKIQYSNVLDFQGKTPVWIPACEVDFESASSTIPTHRQLTANYYNTSGAGIQEISAPEAKVLK